MRLACVERGHRLPHQVLLGAVSVMLRARAPDILRTVFYRPEVFGGPMNAWTQAVMRGPSPWAVGERELFAAFTSVRNQCPF